MILVGTSALAIAIAGTFTPAAAQNVIDGGDGITVDIGVVYGQANTALLIGGVGTGELTNFGTTLASSVRLGNGPGNGGTLQLVGTAGQRGVLETGSIMNGGDGVLFVSGGILRATQSTSNFIQGFAAGSVVIGVGAFIDSNGHDIGIGSVLQGDGGLTKLGDGTLTLNAANTYGGSTTVEAGTLRAGLQNAFVNNTAYVIDAGTLDLNGFDLTASSLSGSGGEVAMGGALLTVNQAGNTTYAGNITGDGLFTKDGAGTLTLSGNNSYTGGTRILSGTLVAQGGHAIGDTSAVILVGGSTLRVMNDETIGMVTSDITDVGTVELHDSNLTTSETTAIATGSFHGDIIGTGGFIKNGAYQQVLAGNDTYSGATQILGGTLYAVGAGRNSIPDASAVTIASGATLSIVDPGFDYPGEESDDETIGSLAGAGTVDLGNKTLTVGSDNTSTLFSGQIKGVDGSLTKTGTGTLALTGINSYTGNTRISGGTLQITTAANLGGGGTLTLDGGTLQSSGNLPAPLLFNPVVLGAAGGTVDSHGSGIAFGGSISGSGALNIIDSTGNGTFSFSGNNSTYSGPTSIGPGVQVFVFQPGSLSPNSDITNNGKISLGADNTIRSLAGNGTLVTLFAAGAGDPPLITSLTIAPPDGTATFSGTIFDSPRGQIKVIKTGAGTEIFSGANTYQGGTVLQGGTLQLGSDTDGTPGNITASAIGIGALTFAGGTLQAGGNFTVANSATINTTGATIDTNGHTFTYSGNIADGDGAGNLTKTGAGTLVFNGNDTYTGLTTVAGGKLIVGSDGHGAASLASDVTVNAGGTLGGHGTIGGNVAINGTLSAGASPGTLTIGGNVVLGGDSHSVFELGKPGVVGGDDPVTGNDLANVGGNLQLGGDLNMVNPAGGTVQSGYYTLFKVAGTTTGDFDLMTATGHASVTSYVTNGRQPGNEVNILLQQSGQNVQFWDGNHFSANGIVDGGAGTWDSGTNWTAVDGAINQFWTGGVGIFDGASGGAVALGGSLDFQGLQFKEDGYTLTGGTLIMRGDPFGNAAASFLNVDDGKTATIASNIAGDAGIGLDKIGSGTLILSGNNTYTGGTNILSGTLQVGADANLGNTTGGLNLNGGTLRYGAAFDSARAVTIGVNNGSIDTNGFNASLTGNISGAGSLIKAGAGTLTLTGTNTYQGSTQVTGGVLVGGANSIAGNLLVSSGASAVFNQAADGTFAGNVSGPGGGGAVTKTGAAVLTLTGTSSLAWTLAAGTMITAAERFSGNVAIAQNTDLDFEQTVDASYAGVISGAGNFTKNGSGTLTMTGNSAGFTGSTEAGVGTLVVNGNLGGTLGVEDGARLGGSGSVGAVTLTDGAHLLGQSGQTLSMQSLTLSAGSNIDVALGSAGSPSLFNVAGALTLDGKLNVSSTGNFGAGIYRLFGYSGSLTNHGLDIGTTPSGATADDLFIQTSVANQVNLISSVGAELRFWDGADAALHDNGGIDGGAGAWTLGGRNWATMDGAINGRFRPNQSFAVFQGRAGTIDVQDNGIAVAGMQFATDGYRITGNALELAGSDGATSIRVGDGFDSGADMTATIDVSLTGASRLVKSDLGTLVLTAANTYTGGTTVEAGKLVGNVDSIRGDIANAGTVVFDQATDASLANNIAGLDRSNGTMVKQGAGVLTLTGISSLDWTVDAGGLVSAVDRFSGSVAIASAANFTFDQASDATYGGVISGAGAFNKAGTGTVLLTADSSRFSGVTTVAGGGLIVGDIGGHGALGGSINVLDGGLLGGHGTVGSGAGSRVSIASGGTLSPGNSIGTLTVNGDLTFAAGSRFAIEANPGGTDSDLVHVTGTATIDGGTVAHIGANGNYKPLATYTILSADQGVTGKFDSVSSDFSFLDPSLGYAGNDVTLTLKRNEVGFADKGDTRNQKATATAIESLAAGNAVYNAIVTMPDDVRQIRAGFDGLSGEIHASDKTAFIDDSHFVRDAMNDRLRAGFAGPGTAVVSNLTYGPNGQENAPATSDRFAVWGTTFGSWGKVSGNGNAADLSADTSGFITGVDGLVANNWRVGAVAGYSRSNFDVDDRASSGISDNYHLGIYGGTQRGAIGFRTGLAYSWHDIDTRRSVGISSLANRLTAGYQAGTAQVFGELGYKIDAAPMVWEPFANVSYVSLHTDGFSEGGNAAALSAKSDSMGTAFSTLGVHASTALSWKGVEGALRGTVGWRHAYGDVVPTSTLAFAGGEDFTVAGVAVARDAAVVEAGVDFRAGKLTTVGVAYQGQYGSGLVANSVSAKVNIRF